MNLSRRALLVLAAASLAFGLSIAANGAAAATADTPHVTLKTSMGNIVLELYPAQAPLSVANFLEYVKSGQYNGTIFHRVIEGFMIQGGGFDKNMHEKATRPPIRNEANNGLKNTTYTLAMARTAAPNSATAQFFINTANNSALDYPSRDGFGYAVFGKVISGTEVIDSIKRVPTGNSGMYQDVPMTPVVIESATVSP
ncbi:MAG: ppiB1 [Herbaspirillum sp.]|nr:ppiB1 [Herbaspirillum sp.]